MRPCPSWQEDLTMWTHYSEKFLSGTQLFKLLFVKPVCPALLLLPKFLLPFLPECPSCISFYKANCLSRRLSTLQTRTSVRSSQNPEGEGRSRRRPYPTQAGSKRALATSRWSVGFSINHRAGLLGRREGASWTGAAVCGLRPETRGSSGWVGAGLTCPCGGLPSGLRSHTAGGPHQGPFSLCTSILGMRKSQCVQNHLAKCHRGVHSL